MAGPVLIEWDIYEYQPGCWIAFAWIGHGLQATVMGRNRPIFDIRVRLWNIYLHWKNR